MPLSNRNEDCPRGYSTKSSLYFKDGMTNCLWHWIEEASWVATVTTRLGYLCTMTPFSFLILSRNPPRPPPHVHPQGRIDLFWVGWNGWDGQTPLLSQPASHDSGSTPREQNMKYKHLSRFCCMNVCWCPTSHMAKHIASREWGIDMITHRNLSHCSFWAKGSETRRFSMPDFVRHEYLVVVTFKWLKRCPQSKIGK